MNDGVKRPRRAALEFVWTITRWLGLERFHNVIYRRRLYAAIHRLFFTPIYYLPAAALRRTSYRLIDPAPHILPAVGHLTIDPDSFLKEAILAGRTIRPILLADRYRPANESLLAYWTSRFVVVRSSLYAALLRPLTVFPDLVCSLEPFGSAMRSASAVYSVQTKWRDRDPLLSLSAEDRVRGEATLRKLGVSEGAWFVCVHSREGGHHAAAEWANEYRNSAIETYSEAMQAIVDRGGVCIRVGDPTMARMPSRIGVIDYAHSPLRSPWMDIFLCARCHFFLGNSSGLFALAGIFGRRSALANMAPLASAYSFFPGDISIPKLLHDRSGALISFVEAYSDERSEYRFATEFSAAEIRHVDNTSDEIRDLALEMLDRLDGNWSASADDEELQSRFRRLLRPHHYGFGGSASIGASFLRLHRHLLN